MFNGHIWHCPVFYHWCCSHIFHSALCFLRSCRLFWTQSLMLLATAPKFVCPPLHLLCVCLYSTPTSAMTGLLIQGTHSGLSQENTLRLGLWVPGYASYVTSRCSPGALLVVPALASLLNFPSPGQGGNVCPHKTSRPGAEPRALSASLLCELLFPTKVSGSLS